MVSPRFKAYLRKVFPFLSIIVNRTRRGLHRVFRASDNFYQGLYNILQFRNFFLQSVQMAMLVRKMLLVALAGAAKVAHVHSGNVCAGFLIRSDPTIPHAFFDLDPNYTPTGGCQKRRRGFCSVCLFYSGPFACGTQLPVYSYCMAHADVCLFCTCSIEEML
jgi:hypothetical protein